MSLRSHLGKAKGLGSAKSGSHHWYMQRLTAIAMFLLVSWFVIIVVKSAQSQTNFIISLESPYNTVLYILMIGIGTYHGVLGFQVVVEDYVHSVFFKNFILIFAKVFSLLTASLAILSIIYYHVNIGLNI